MIYLMFQYHQQQGIIYIIIYKVFFGHINVTNSTSSWSINSSGSATFPSLNSGISSISTLAVGSPNVRGTGDLLTVSVTSTGNYIYLNNGGALGGYNDSFIFSLDD